MEHKIILRKVQQINKATDKLIQLASTS